MNILKINLRHLYQRLSYWFFWFGLVCAIIGIFAAVHRGRTGAFEGFLIWMYMFGLVTSSMQVEVLTKPFAFCLPGHNVIPRKYLFTMVFSVSFFFGVLFLFYPGRQAVLTSISTIFAGTIIYWLAALVVFSFSNWISTVAVIALLGFSEYLNIPAVTKNVIVNEWVFVVSAGILINLLAYTYWGKKGIARKYCGRMWLSGFDAWDREKLSKYREARLAEKQKNLPASILPKIETFFISRISNAGENLSRYIWGGLYKSFAVMLSYRNNWIGTLIGILLMLLFFGYMGRGCNIIFLMPAFAVVSMSLQTHSTLLISGGRRERFWTALILGTVAALLITAFVTLAASITLWLEPIMPVLALKGQQFSFKALNINLFFIPLFMIPLAFTFGLIFYKKTIITMIIVMMVFQVIFIFLIINPSHKRIVFTPAQVMASLLCSWAVFVSVLRYICMKCSLVK